MNACRNIVTRVLAPLAASAALLFAGTPMFAQAAGTGVHDLGIFQLDGDAFVGTCGGTATGPSAFGGLTGCTGDDWDNLYTCHGTFGDCTTNTAGNPSGGSCTPGQAPPNNCASVIAQFKVDPAPFSIFTGGGSKDEQDLSSWQWVDGSVPDKDDIIEAGAALYIVPSNLPRAGHHILYFMANRFANNGDAQIGVWFFQNAVEAAGTGVHASPFVDPVNGGPAHHRVGDILILSNFVQGGGNANIQVYAVTAANGVGFIKGKGNKIICPTNVPGIPQEVAPSSDGICTTQLVNGTAGANGVCNDPDQTACAATNGIVEASLDPAFFAKSGAGSGQYPVVGFFEGGIDLTALNLANECFSNFLVETRSSQSITAVLKDFTLGEFQRCAAKISTQIIEPDTPDFEVTGQSVIPGTVIYDRATVESAATGVANDPGHGSTTGTCAALGLARDCTVTFKLYNVTVNPTTGDVQGCGAGGSTLVSAGFTNPQSSFCETSGVGSGKCIAKTTNFTTQQRGYIADD